MIYLRTLPGVQEVKERFLLCAAHRAARAARLADVQAILSGQSARKLLLIGPCSADDEQAVLTYMTRLAALREQVEDRFLIIPRAYTAKPRTTGTGYKGLLHRPDATAADDDLSRGIFAARGLHFRIMQETGFFCADELLYPEVMPYLDDLLLYTVVGARSVEDQQHRQVASGLNIPVGMKNPMSGDTEVMLDAVLAAQEPQRLLLGGWECRTEGNPFAHAIVRGYLNAERQPVANYHYADICTLYRDYHQKNLRNAAVIVDCNHGNSAKRYAEQIPISREVLRLCREQADIGGFIKGVMIESYLIDGAQADGEAARGKSITDPCLGWKKTQRLIETLYEEMK